MNYNVNIREEVFGATVFDLIMGKRYYITKKELDIFLNNGVLPNDVKIDNSKEVKIIPLDKKNDKIKYFSFADISYFEVTRACNLRCKHCLNNSGDIMKNQLTYTEMVEIIKGLSKAGIQEIRFTGGEPLVFKGIFELIELATSLGIYTSIGTNGTLVTKEVAKKLKKAGLKKAIVSIDGTEKKHDYLRGIGNYKKAINGINNLQANGIDIRINSVILKTNIEDVIDLAKQLHKEKKSLFIRRFIESGRGTNLIGNMLTKKDYEYVKEKLNYELENGNYVNGHYLKNDDEAIHSRIELPFKIEDGCKAGQRALVITPEGGIHLCGFLAAQGFPPVGNVREFHNWRNFWREIQEKDHLYKLRSELSKYNQISGIQPTNCLAYVQRFNNLKQDELIEK